MANTPKPIYMLAYVSEEDYDYGRSHWTEDIDPDYGYFTTREEAQKQADVTNVSVRNRYDNYALSVTNANRQRQAEAVNKVAAWKITVAKNKALRDAGFEAKDPARPSGAWKDNVPIPYEEWCKNQNRNIVVEIVRGAVD